MHFLAARVVRNLPQLLINNSISIIRLIIDLEKITDQRKRNFQTENQTITLTIHHFVSPRRMLSANNCTHLVEKIEIVFLDLSCSFYIHKIRLRDN